MALATQCPHCHTTFRVAQDQLKLRAGLVRCGNCKEIFNGIEHLRSNGQPAVPPARVPAAGAPQELAPAAPPVTIAQAAHAHPPADTPVSFDTMPVAMPEVHSLASIPPAIVPDAPLGAADPVAPDAGNQAPAAEKPVVSIPDEPDFIDFFDLIKPPEPAAQPESVTPATAPSAPANDTEVHASPASIAAAAAPGTDASPDDPLQRMTLMVISDDAADDEQPTPETPASSEDAADAEQAGDPDQQAVVAPDDAMIAYPPGYDPDSPDPIDAAITDLKRKPKRSRKDRATPDEDDLAAPEEADEPSFVRSGRRRERSSRTLRILLGLLSFLLLLGALGQGAYIFRNQIAARLPETKPLLVEACAMAGCSVGLPAQIDAVSIESSELQTLPASKDNFVLTTLLRNRSQIVQAWPNIELTLNDNNDKPVVRRVFTPRDYLASASDQSKGIAPVSEQTVKISFELTQLRASGYRVYLFYP